MPRIPSGVPRLPDVWRHRDVAAVLVMLFGMFMLGTAMGGGYLSPPFVFVGVLPFALGFAHLWHVVLTTDSEAATEVTNPPSSLDAPRRTRDRSEADATRADPIDTLKERYAAGELGDDELDRRIERLVELEALETEASKSAVRERATER